MIAKDIYDEILLAQVSQVTSTAIVSARVHQQISQKEEANKKIPEKLETTLEKTRGSIKMDVSE